MMCALSISLGSCIFIFFKQKTAYEVRISDWSSDVCSSDLPNKADWFAGRWSGLHKPADAETTRQSVESAISQKLFDSLGKTLTAIPEIGRASCRDRVCQYV